MNRAVDHIVYCVHNLEDTILEFERKLGITPIIGGQHLTKGTKNALVNLGKGCYLELLSIDENNKAVQKERWMGIDLLSTPQITRWCLKSYDLDKDAKVVSQYKPSMGTIEKGRRKTPTGSELSWGMILPLTSPEVELVPFMTDWSTSTIHPTDNIPDTCLLIGMEFYHPDPAEVQAVFDSLSVSYTIIKSKEIKITATIQGPKGTITI